MKVQNNLKYVGTLTTGIKEKIKTKFSLNIRSWMNNKWQIIINNNNFVIYHILIIKKCINN